MVQNPPAGQPQCCPCLFYDDVAAAARFLQEAFGFRERFVARDPTGRVEHAQLGYGSAVVMLGAARSPRALHPCAPAGELPALHAGVYLYVDDVAAHHERARTAGARVLLAPADMHWGDRIYCALDPEGQFWTFAVHTRDPTAQDG
jgi:uncharacterized glyoxalase superfamily protein PhnB